MELLKGIEIVDLALYISEYKALVVADLHIGYEEALRKQGVFVPKFHFRDLVKRLEKIFALLEKKGKKGAKTVETIIINGDLKHEFGRISEEEWRNTLRLIDWLVRKCGKVLLVQGNHDKILGPIADKRNVQLVDSVLLGENMIIHGDKEVEIPPSVKTLVIAHDHPAVSVSDGVRTETYKCFLVGKHNESHKHRRRNLIVMPSMNPIVEGTDVLKEKLLSPYLHKDLGNFEAYIVGDKVYNFGKLKKLK
jgi:putative SbcD/Mre11-related phosphoesterase